MAVMVTSFRGSVDEWLVQLLPSDLYLRLEASASGGLDAALQQRLAAAPGIARIEFRQIVPLLVTPERPAVVLFARAVDPAAPGRTLPLVGGFRTPPAGATPVWISEPFARIYRVRLGQTIRLPLGGGTPAPMFVAGVWRDYSEQFGSLAVTQADYTRLTGDRSRSEAVIDVRRGVPVATVAARVRAVLPPQIAASASVAEPRQLRALALSIFDRSFAVTYALEAIAVIVGLTGVAATFSAQTLARRKEFGMLRHVGVQRRQILAMLSIEGALLGAVGAVAGCALGTAMSQVLIGVVNPQSFNWTMQTRLPWPLFAGLAVALVATSAGTAALAGRGAVSEAAVRAVREDW
jgi:putative ABC transport system permease protein